MSRKIEKRQYSLTGPDEIDDPVKEINRITSSETYEYLLAFADDGVIWGSITKEGLRLSSDEDAFPQISENPDEMKLSPELRAVTLQEARLFGENGECFIWRTKKGYCTRTIAEGAVNDVKLNEGQAYDEAYILWGTNFEKQKEAGGFFMTEEADLGIRHAPPKPLTERHSLRLVVRNYVDFDEAGAAYVKYSRLVNLLNGGEK